MSGETKFVITGFCIIILWVVCGLIQSKRDSIYNSTMGWLEILVNLLLGPIKLVCDIISDYF